jgi:hypothetical protein|tara:strand:- start:630 stop:797 length:168 start_codon:yes stop_codon:yes gene_type:complete
MNQELFYLVKDVGVPTFFCIMLSFLLWRVVAKGMEVIEKNTGAIDKLKEIIISKL